ncbi:TatD family hydrolase [Corynebacterium mendelii]|uniref:TatD family hydrolase n=1 Tax=Corynebacterium mendelii TaxID=2765362 RepID=A0A939E3F8_9CORY|nr:TatD family hydrolase [Corynebacterium mendelii]MBN9644732.1 TatD family hydrolase [Corynebacterium mendelii]
MSKSKKNRPQPCPADRIPGLVDAHTHLASCGGWEPETAAGFVDRAADAGVEKICTVGDGLDECAAAVAVARDNPRVYAAVAIHPTRAAELSQETKTRLAALAADPRVVAIGETGLDTYWIGKSDSCAPLDMQEAALRWHIDLAVETGKALMIHNREADADLLRILADAPQPKEVMLHCFSSPVEVAREAIDRGYVLSFTGNVTFKNNGHLRQAAALAPAGQLLVETDAPYMTPEPFRGRKNEPSLIGHTYLCIAEARGMRVADLADEVGATFDRVFGLAEPA